MAISAVFFDAAGTLIHPAEPIFQTYHRFGVAYGFAGTVEDLRMAYASAWKTQEQQDIANGWIVSESREEERWRGIVSACFPTVSNIDQLYSELWQYFADPEAWHLFDDVEPAFADLRRWNVPIAIGSNFDSRLHPIADSFSVFDGCEVFVSSTIGWRKPSPEFFHTLCRETAVAPEEALFVGDDIEVDVKGAETAGLRALLVDRKSESLFRLVSSAVRGAL